jgi:hypothetical protein
MFCTHSPTTLIIYAQAGLAVCQHYVPEKCRTNQTKFPFKTLYFLGVGGNLMYIVYDYITSGHMDLQSIYVMNR